MDKENSKVRFNGKWLWATVYVIFIFGVSLVGALLYPKYDLRFIGFGFLLLIDFATLIPIRKYILGAKRYLKSLLLTWYWLPLVLLSFFMALSMIWPIQNWPSFMRIYLPGIMIPLFISKFIFDALFLIFEAIQLPVNFIVWVRTFQNKTLFKWKRIRILVSISFIIGALPIVILFPGFVFWIYDFKIHQVEIQVKQLPASFDGFKIVQLSDIHLGSWISSKPLERAFALVNQQKPDIIVFTGDMVNFTSSEAIPFENSLKALKASQGIFAVLGNHDYGDYIHWNSKAEHDLDNLKLEQIYQTIGWNLLKNSHAFIHKNGDSIAIIGVENWSQKKIWGQRGNLTLAADHTQGAPVKILLSHDPTHWDGEVNKAFPDIVLTLSGHTHAMQMGWETGFGRWSPAELIFKEWAGLYSQKGKSGMMQYLYVNRGLGHLGIPARIGIRPEITVIVLRKG